MSKIKINVELKDRTKGLFSKEENIRTVLLDIPTVDPSSLNPFDDEKNKIFRVEVKPIKNQLSVMSDGRLIPDTGISGLNQVGVVSEVVNMVALVKIGKDNYARINGSVDMPLTGHLRRSTIEEAWFTDQDTANAVCLAAAEVELEKALQMQEEVNGAVKALSIINEVYSGAKESARLKDRFVQAGSVSGSKRRSDDDDDERPTVHIKVENNTDQDVVVNDVNFAVE